MVVADQRAGEQVRLAEDLEAVADAEDRQAALCGGDQGVHHGCEPGDRAAAEVVAVGEAAGQHDRVDGLQGAVAVPQGDRVAAGQPHGAGGVDVVERAREGDDADLHWTTVTA